MRHAYAPYDHEVDRGSPASGFVGTMMNAVTTSTALIATHVRAGHQVRSSEGIVGATARMVTRPTMIRLIAKIERRHVSMSVPNPLRVVAAGKAIPGHSGAGPELQSPVCRLDEVVPTR